MNPRFEYKNIKFLCRLARTNKEIAYLEIDGVATNLDAVNVMSLPALLNQAGNEGWELVSHSKDRCSSGVVIHDLYLKREKSLQF